MIPGMNAIPTGGGALEPMTVTYQTYGTDTNDSSTYTFSSLAVGTAYTGRRLFVAVHFGDEVGLTSMTIGGASPTIVASDGDGGTTGWETHYALITDETNSTLDIVLNLGGTAEGAAVVVWDIEGMTAARETPTATATATGASPSTTISVTEGGVLFVSASKPERDGAASSFTGVTALYDLAYGGIDACRAAGGEQNISATNASYSIGIDYSNASTKLLGVAFT